jgi:hypothetical protein
MLRVALITDQLCLNALTVEARRAVGLLVEGDQAAWGCVMCLAGYTTTVHKPCSLWAVLRAVAAAPGLSLASLQELCRIIVK